MLGKARAHYDESVAMPQGRLQRGYLCRGKELHFITRFVKIPLSIPAFLHLYASIAIYLTADDDA
jgi:hypothetical protein